MGVVWVLFLKRGGEQPSVQVGSAAPSDAGPLCSWWEMVAGSAGGKPDHHRDLGDVSQSLSVSSWSPRRAEHRAGAGGGFVSAHRFAVRVYRRGAAGSGDEGRFGLCAVGLQVAGRCLQLTARLEVALMAEQKFLHTRQHNSGRAAPCSPALPSSEAEPRSRAELDATQRPGRAPALPCCRLCSLEDFPFLAGLSSSRGSPGCCCNARRGGSLIGKAGDPTPCCHLSASLPLLLWQQRHVFYF